MTPLRVLFLSLLLSCAMPVKRTTAAPPPPAEAQAPTADTLLASDSVRARSFMDAFASPVSYPAVPVELLPDSSAEMLSAQGVFEATESARVLGRYGYKRKWRFSEEPFRPKHWYRAETHPLLAAVLPGVSFYLVDRERFPDPRLDNGDWAYVLAIRQGKSYLLPNDLNQLLFDAGMRFGNSDVPAWLNTGALVWAAVYRHYLLGVRQEDIPRGERSDFPFLPALSLDSLQYDATGTRTPRQKIFMHVGERAIELRVMSDPLPPSDGVAEGPSERLAPFLFVADSCGGRELFIDPITTAAPPPPAEAQAPTADTLPASDSVRTQSFLDSFPDAVSYPGTTLEPKAEGPDAESLGKAIGSAYGPMVRTAVYFSGRHSLLDSMLPGVDFIRAHVENDFDLEGWARHAVKGGKLQRLDALNRLLLDAGFTFDSTEMPTIAKIAVLFATFGRGPTPSDTAPGAGFPAITFLSVKKDQRHYRSGYVAQGIRVDCTIGGARNQVFVKFDWPDSLGRAAPDRVMGVGLDFMITPLITINLPPPHGE